MIGTIIWLLGSGFTLLGEAILCLGDVFKWLAMTPIHIGWGILRSIFHALVGFCRPGPDNDPVAYAEHPYSVWKGVFMAYVWELAGVQRGIDPPCEVTVDVDDPRRPAAAPQPWPGYVPSIHYFAPVPARHAGGLKCKQAMKNTGLRGAVDTVAARLGVTTSILQQAGKETRDRLTAELSTMLTVCTFIGGFIFTTLVDPAGTGAGGGGPASSSRAEITLQSNLTGAATQFYTGTDTFNLSSTQTNSTQTSPAFGTTFCSAASWDLYGLLAGLTLVIALTCVGIYARLLVLLQWSASTTSLYRLIARWERAMSANQVMFFAVLTLSYASALVACWDRYGGSKHWVFKVLLAASVVFWWFFANFWARSMWWREDGIMQKYSRLYHQRLVGVDQGMFSNGCSLTAQRIPVASIRYTFHGLLDQHLLGINY